MDKRKYMSIIANFFDWCYINNVDTENITDTILNRYINLNSDDKDIENAMMNFKNFL